MRGTGFLAIWSDVEAADLTSLTGPAKSSFIKCIFALDARIADFG